MGAGDQNVEAGDYRCRIRKAARQPPRLPPRRGRGRGGRAHHVRGQWQALRNDMLAFDGGRSE
jgi:hypothetical protein